MPKLDVEYEGSTLTRTLAIKRMTSSINFRVKDSKDNNSIGATIANESAVDLAKKILLELEPSALARLPFNRTPVGTYLHNVRTGLLIKVVEYEDALFPMYTRYPNEDEEETAWAIRDTGDGFLAYQDPIDPVWEEVDAERVAVSTRTAWELKAEVTEFIKA